jgi:hypothetical protein
MITKIFHLLVCASLFTSSMPFVHSTPVIVNVSKSDLQVTQKYHTIVERTIAPFPPMVVFKEPAMKIIPLARDTIPAAKYDYGCQETEWTQCVTSSMTFDEQVAHTLAAEGSMDGLQLLVDMLQVMHNRAVNAWECSIYECGVPELERLNPNKIPWSEITQEQGERLMLYLLSQPYTSRGKTYPVWNGWSQKLELLKISKLYPHKLRNYELTLRAVKYWRENCIGYDHADENDTCIFLKLDTGKVIRPQHSVCPTNVLYVYAHSDSILRAGSSLAAVDKLDYGNRVVYVHFLTAGGYLYDSDR